jgi:thiamine-phosphate pyrophosphorylase
VLLPRFYPILDIPTLEARSCDPVRAAEAILDAGARILQYRDKSTPTRQSLEQMRLVAEITKQAGATFVINDRVDLAMMLRAAVHLGQEDLPPAEARRIAGSELLIGYSTHNESQFRAAAAEPVNYLALGPIFGTVSKANPDPIVGVEELRRLRPLSPHPLVAIGGVTRATAHQVLEAGADSLAIIGDLYPHPATPDSIRTRTREWITLTQP